MKTYQVWITLDIRTNDNLDVKEYKNFVQENLNQTGATDNILGAYKATNLKCEDVSLESEG